ncbi:MAG: hypothetical protein RAK25_05700, partial [TACK group archaeon]|nr:hypothetical protein [TACK group archaeon]
MKPLNVYLPSDIRAALSSSSKNSPSLSRFLTDRLGELAREGDSFLLPEEEAAISRASKEYSIRLKLPASLKRELEDRASSEGRSASRLACALLMNYALKDRDARVAHSALFKASREAIEKFVETGDKSALSVSSAPVHTWESSNYEALGRRFYNVLASLQGEQRVAEALRETPERASAIFDDYEETVKALIEDGKKYPDAKKELERLGEQLKGKDEIAARLQDAKKQLQLDAATIKQSEKLAETRRVEVLRLLKERDKAQKKLQTVDDLQEKLKGARERIAELILLRDSLQSENARLRSKVNRQAIELKAKDEKIAELTKQLENQKKDADFLNQERDEYEEQLEDRISDLESQKNSLMENRDLAVLWLTEARTRSRLAGVAVEVQRGETDETPFADLAAQMAEMGEKFAWKAGELQERANASAEASARLWSSLSVFADQKDAKELLDRANEGVKGKVSVKLEDQVAMIRGYDDKRKLVLGFGFVRYAANSILARALDVYTSALLPREYKLEELKQLRYEAANFSLNPRPSLVLQGGIRVPSLVELVKKQNAEQNYANLASLYGDTVDIY